MERFYDEMNPVVGSAPLLSPTEIIPIVNLKNLRLEFSVGCTLLCKEHAHSVIGYF
jgi:hypothetical protein